MLISICKHRHIKFKDRHPTYFNQNKSLIQPAASEIILGNYTPINEMSFQPDDGNQFRGEDDINSNEVDRSNYNQHNHTF